MTHDIEKPDGEDEPRETRVVFYEDKKGEHRWQLYAANGELVAESGEGYTRRVDAHRAFRQAYRIMETAYDNWIQRHG